jgi:hypothetical protein
MRFPWQLSPAIAKTFHVIAARRREDRNSP